MTFKWNNYQVWHYSDWAKEHSTYAPNDIGMDLVAKIKNNTGFALFSVSFAHLID